MRVFAVLGLLLVAVVRAYPDLTAALGAETRAPVAEFHSTVSSVTAADLPRTWRPGCPVSPSDLRRVALDHWGFDGTVHDGELIVHRAAVPQVIDAFRRLYDIRYPIRRMDRVDRYGGDDDASMEADNTSAFNCRRTTGSTTRWSEHSFGRAVDVNPMENPYVRGSTVLPATARAEADRRLRRPTGECGVATVGLAQGKQPGGGRWTTTTHSSASISSWRRSTR